MKKNKIEIKQINIENIKNDIIIALSNDILENIEGEFYSIYKCIEKWKYNQMEIITEILKEENSQNINSIANENLFEKFNNLGVAQEQFKKNFINKYSIRFFAQGMVIEVIKFCNSYIIENYNFLETINTQIEDIIALLNDVRSEYLAKENRLVVKETNKHIKQINEIVEDIIEQCNIVTEEQLR